MWTKTADEILDTLAAYCRRINDSGHYQIVTRRALNKITRGRGADLVDLLDEAADPVTGPAAQAERNLAVCRGRTYRPTEQGRNRALGP